MIQTAIAITGASGYIGSSLAKRLVNDGFKVICLVRKNSNLEILEQVKNDVVFFDEIDSIVDMVQLFKEQQVNTVMHLASCFIAEHASSDVEKLINSNILFGSKLLEAMDVAKVKNFINTGTSWQHFQGSDYDPVCLYAATKEAFEKLIDFYVNARDLKCLTLKLFDTYGPNDPRKKIIPFLLQLSKNDDVLEMSAGDQEVNFVHVYDVVDAYMRALQMMFSNTSTNGYHHCYVVASENSKPLKDTVKCFEESLGKKLNIRWGAKPYRLREMMTLSVKVNRLPGWQPKYNFPEGLFEQAHHER